MKKGMVISMRYYKVFYSYDVARKVPREDGYGYDLLVYARDTEYVVMQAKNKKEAKGKAINWLWVHKFLNPTVTDVSIVTKGF